MSKNYNNVLKLNNITGSIDDNTDVSLSGVANGKFLQYSTTSGTWLPSSSGNFTILSVNNQPVSTSGHQHNTTDIVNFNSGVSGLINGIYAPLYSPTFSGTPTVPTAPSGSNTNQIASTAFVSDAVNRVQSIQGTQGLTGSQIGRAHV